MNKCYDCQYCMNCENCSECIFSSNMVSCSHCFMCTNLTHKKYYFKNKEYSAQDYTEILLKASLSCASSIQKIREYFHTWRLQYPQKNLQTHHCDNVENSDNLSYCGNSSYIFEANNIIHSKFFWIGDGAENCYDCTVTGESNWCYDSVVADNSYMVLFSFFCRESRSCMYCYNCLSCEDCFGCVSLKK